LAFFEILSEFLVCIKINMIFY